MELHTQARHTLTTRSKARLIHFRPLNERDHGWSRLIPRAFRLRESRIRRQFYAVRSKRWWARPSNHSLVALTWSKFDEMHGLTEMVRHVDEELSDYSASAREDLERFIAIGGLSLGSLAIYESVMYAELGPRRPWLTIGVPALAALSALIVAALRPACGSLPKVVARLRPCSGALNE